MRRSRPSGFASLLLVLLLLVPPVGNVLHREFGHLIFPFRPEVDPAFDGPDATTALRRQLENADLARHRLEIELDEVRGRLETLQRWKVAQPAHVPRAARVLPLADPSSSRDSLWVVCPGNVPIARDTVVVVGNGLVGHVRGIRQDDGSGETLTVGDFTLARVQTTLDRNFRIRARIGTGWGFLGGTGETDESGKPLLTLEFLSSDTPLEKGQKVFTDGLDDRHPAGVFLGEVTVALRQGANPAYVVRAAVAPGRSAEAVLLVNPVLEAALGAARGILAEERS